MSGIMLMGFAAIGVIPPTVNIIANGRINSDDDPVNVWSGQRFASDGTEDEYNQGGGLVDLGTWLTTGSAEDVWIEFVRTAGDAGWSNNGDLSTRHQMSSTWTWRHYRTTVGVDTITGYFRAWDAASGGNILDTGPTATWSAQVTFNPCPTCCFTADTMITMADGSYRRIADVREGDKVLTPSEDGLSYGEMEVTEVIVRLNRPMHRIHISNGVILEASEDHPLYVEGKGWSSVNPDPRTDYKDIGLPDTLEIGDRVCDEHGYTHSIVNIEPLEYTEAVFTFKESQFFANGILVY